MEWVRTLGISLGAFLLVMVFADMARAEKPFRIYRVVTKTVVRDFYNKNLAMSYAKLHKSKVQRVGEDRPNTLATKMR